RNRDELAGGQNGNQRRMVRSMEKLTPVRPDRGQTRDTSDSDLRSRAENAQESPRTAAPSGSRARTVGGSQRKTSRFRRYRWVMFAFVVPSLVVYLAIVIVPSIQSVQYSFTDWDGLSSTYNYVGADNYAAIVGSGRFWNATKNTLILGQIGRASCRERVEVGGGA